MNDLFQSITGDLAFKLQQPRQKLDHREEARILVILRATPFDDSGPFRVFANDVFAQLADQSRLAQAGVADQQHNLAQLFLRLLPAIFENRQFRIAANQRREVARISQLNTIARRRFLHHLEQLHRLRHPTDALSTQGFALEEQRDSPVRRRAQQDRSRFSNAAQSNGGVTRLADQRNSNRVGTTTVFGDGFA